MATCVHWQEEEGEKEEVTRRGKRRKTSTLQRSPDKSRMVSSIAEVPPMSTEVAAA